MALARKASDFPCLFVEILKEKPYIYLGYVVARNVVVFPAGKESQAGPGRWLTLLGWFRLDHNEQCDAKHGEHAKRGGLAVPRS
jgi:hypothetical protein